MHPIRTTASVCIILMMIIEGVAGDPVPASDLATQAFSVLERHCYRCHGGVDSTSQVDVTDRAALVDRADERSGPWVVPGDPAASRLIVKVLDERSMPEPGSDEAASISPAERSLLQEWVRAGAPFPEKRKARFVSFADVYEAIAADLDSLPEAERQATRYFTLAHLHGNPKVTTRSLSLHRAALSKTLHSLTWKSGVHLPRTIAGADSSVLAIDLRDFGWGDEEWDFWVSHDPYRVGFASVSGDDRLRTAYKRVRELAGLTEPVLRADWFIVNALQPELYQRILGLPERLVDLELLLGVDLRQSFLEGTQQRAGFGRSHVSQQNRLLVRSPARYTDYFWISYDFFPGTRRGDLHSFPLGPVFDGHPEPKHAFEHDGGEVIFALPSGMQGYFLVDGQGKRIPAGPIEVVHDVGSPLGKPQILNGVSCVVCHRQGMITGFTDELREAGTFGGTIAARLNELHPEVSQMRQIVEQDRTRFLEALERIVVPFLSQELKAGETLESLPEPVGEVIRQYRSDLKLAEIAAEIGISDPEKLAARISGERSLLELGLGQLVRTPGATISRDRWERTEGFSLHQELLREVHVGASCWSRSKAEVAGF